jgi:hypothetical protein
MSNRRDPIRIEIRIDRALARRVFIAVAVVAVLVTAGVGLAVPTKFQDGQVLKAADLNASLGDLETRLAALETFKSTTTKGGTYSLGGTICGLTDKTTGNMLGLAGEGSGLVKAKAACAAVAGCSPTAHMCTLDEVARSAATGNPNAEANGWMLAGGLGVSLQYTGYTNNCQGYTSAVQTFQGGIGGLAGAYSSCSNLMPVLCCD